MAEPSIFFSEVNERQGIFHRRAFLLGGFAGLGLSALGVRLAFLQLIQTQRYEKLSASNQFNFRLVPPPRGLIVDRGGEVLASNRPNFRLYARRDDTISPEAMMKSLATFLPIDEKLQLRLAKEMAQAPKNTPTTIMEDMSWEEFSAVNVRAPELPGVTADMGEVRVYPHGGAFAHVIGYVAKVNREDLTTTGPNSDPILLHPGFRIGRQGVEKAFDLDLRGAPGARKIEVDARGREVREDEEGNISSTPGKTIRLSLDVDVQRRALEVFGDASGAAVMLDCRTGEVLCMVSAPSFDANQFVRGLKASEYNALAGYERRPLLDKALSGTYPPGSTFKPMTAMAALTAGIDPSIRINCPGGWGFGGRYFRCWKKDGHGPQTMHEAIKNSCDVYFYQRALEIGPDVIGRVARSFGLGQVFDLGIPGQKKGIVPDRAWKKRAYRDPQQQVWYPGETPSFGIGQGALAVNALQLAVMTARIANGGKAVNPRLIAAIGDREMAPSASAPPLPFPAEHIAYVREGMAAVANDVTGGAFRQSQLGLGGLKMAGKTGTAQVRSFDKGSRSDVGMPWRLKAHNLFIAFAPYDAPRYALSLIVQHGGGSGATEAAPRAREIMRAALIKDPELRLLIESPTPSSAMGGGGPIDEIG